MRRLTVRDIGLATAPMNYISDVIRFWLRGLCLHRLLLIKWFRPLETQNEVEEVTIEVNFSC
jgi:hypothetical protein